MNALVRIATLSFVLALPVTSFAQTTQELADARTHYQAGEAKFKTADYETALKEFRLAEQVKTTPQAARYIGLSADKLGRYAEAVAAYERFLSDVPPKLESEKETIKKRVGEIKAMPGSVKVTTHPTDAKIGIDGQPGLPSPREFNVPAGRHMVKVTADGWTPTEQEVNVTYATKQDVHVKLEKDEKTVAAVAPVPSSTTTASTATTTTTTTTEAPKPKSMVPVYVTAGVAGAALVTGSIFGILALKDSSDFDKAPTTSKADSGETKALVADLCLGLAVTFGITSIVLAVTKDEEPHSEDEKKAARIRIIPTPIITSNGGGAGAVIRF